MFKKITALLLTGLLLCGSFVGCGKQEKATVSVQSVGLLCGIGSVGLQDSYAGVVSAGESIRVERDEEMKVKELLVSVGDLVEEGQILFSYDTETINLSLEKMRLELEQMKASSELKTAQLAELEKQRERAKQEDQLDYTLQIQELQIDLTEAALEIKGKEKEIQQTEAYLEHDQVLAPGSGRIQAINENGGTDEMGNPLPFISIAQVMTYRVKGIINEQNAASLMIGMPITIRSRVDPEQTWSGAVEMIDWENPVSSGNYWGMPEEDMSQSSKYPFYVALESDEGLMLGQHVYIEPRIESETEQTEIPLPAWCLNDADTDAPWVWAVDAQEHLEKRPVRLGEYDPATDTYPVLEGLTLTDYIAPPGEDCAEGAEVVFYSEADFEPPVNTRENLPGEEVVEEGGYVDNGEGGIFENGGFAGEGGFEEGPDFAGEGAFDADDPGAEDGENREEAAEDGGVR